MGPIFRQTVQPHARSSDRRWVPTEGGLSRWGGEGYPLGLEAEPGVVGNAVGEAASPRALRTVSHVE